MAEDTKQPKEETKDNSTVDIEIITPKQQARMKKMDIIINKLEQGMWFKDSCTMAGIDEDTGHRWKKENTDFADRVEAAIITYKEKLIACVNLGALKNPQVALKVLETRWGSEWNTVKKIEIVDPQKEITRIQDLIYGSTTTPEGATK